MSAVAVAAVATAGIGIAGAAGAFAPGQPAPPNVGAMTADQINAEIASTPANFQMQNQYNPQFAALNRTIAWQNLFGTPAGTATGTTQAAQTGWYDANGNYLGPANMYSAAPANATWRGMNDPFVQGAGNGMKVNNLPQPPAGATLYQQGQILPQTTKTAAAPGSLATAAAAQPALLAMQTQGRAQDIADVAALGPAAYGAMRAYNPAVTSLYDTMDQQAQNLVSTNGALDPFTTMQLQQQYRAAEAARGTAGGPSDAAMESYYQAATQEQRRLTNLGVAGTVAGQTAGYYGDPFQQVLSRTSGGVQVPGQTYTANQPSAVANTASLLNPAVTQVQGNGYAAQVGAQNAGYLSQQSSLAGLTSLLNPQNAAAIGSGISAIGNYFNPPGVGSNVAINSVAAPF